MSGQMKSNTRRFVVIAFLQCVFLGVFISYTNDLSITALNARILSHNQADVYITTADVNNLITKVDLVHPKPKHYEPPKLVWLLSFPNSGASYTLNLISRLSHTYVATNYGDDNKMDLRASFPVYQDQSRVGPFWLNLTLYPNYTYPKEYVIVHTQCRGTGCESCGGPSENVETTRSFGFRRACQRGTQRTVLNGTMIHSEVSYPITRLTKAIHMIRDPFENIVARFHAETSHNPGKSLYNKTKEGFRAYCRSLNKQFPDGESTSILFDKAWLDLSKDIPCGAQFFRWIEWHVQAFHLTEDLQLETLVLVDESYDTKNFNTTCNRLLEFLSLTRHDDPEPSADEYKAKYHSYFTSEERQRMGQIIQQKSSNIVWRYVSKYFLNVTVSD